MPKLNDGAMEEVQVANTTFGYSAMRLDHLGASEYTLVTLLVDVSGSVGNFAREMEACIEAVVQACRFSPRADNLMLRVLTFNDRVHELHGYKLLDICKEGDYTHALNCGGMTALCDAAANGMCAMGDYARSLTDNDYAVNCILIAITDGADNASHGVAAQVAEAKAAIVRKEHAESVRSILVGVNTAFDAQLTGLLRNFRTEAGFDQYEDVQRADAQALAKLAEFVSKSVSAQSQALGSGGPSKPIALTI